MSMAFPFQQDEVESNITLIVYTAVFEDQNSSHLQYMTVFDGHSLVILTLAFGGIQTKTSFLEYEKQVIFNMTLFF
jgi:hypothetical protein